MSVQPVVVVTGAARGIGLTTTQLFLREGYRVAMLDIRTAPLERAQAELAAQLGEKAAERLLALSCDVASETQTRATADKIMATFGRVDALVCNAGTAEFKPLLDHSFEEWRGVMATNLDGVFLGMQVFAPFMLQNRPDVNGQKGSIVNIASISGLRASSLRVAYGTSKAAVIHLTKQQAIELGDMGIRCNAVAPGPVDTDMAKKVHSAEVRRDYHNAIPLNRYGSEAEIGEAIVFLCSTKASYINGQTLAVDGGFDASGIGLIGLRA